MPPILHLTRTGPWNDAQGSGVYPIPGPDLFIHCCHPRQLAGVVDRFYPEPNNDVLVLTVDPDGLRFVLEGATDVADDFPHLYSELPIDAVTDVRPLAVALAEADLADDED